MIDRAKAHPKIYWELDNVVEEILTEPRPPLNKEALSGLKLKNTQTGEEKTLKVEGLFVAIGHTPNTYMFEDSLQLDEKKYILTQGKSSKTKIPGVFACGDAQDSIYRQAVTAAGSGCAAAIDCERFLESQGH